MTDILVDSDEIKRISKHYFRERLLEETHNIISIIMEQYDELLIQPLGDSVTTALHPSNYRDLFYNKLSVFNYLSDSEESLIFTTPDIDNFDFSDGLEFIHMVLYGLPGEYVEIEKDDFMSVFNELHVDGPGVIALPEGIYLVKRTSQVNRLENILDKRFDTSPFSKSKSIDIFSDADIYVDDNLDLWIDDSVKKAKAIFGKSNSRGALR